MADRPSDFVQVRLTEHGRTHAGEHPLRISNGRRSHIFSGDTPVKVERSYEWNAFLSKRRHHDGKPLFELVPQPIPTVAKPRGADKSTADAGPTEE